MSRWPIASSALSARLAGCPQAPAFFVRALRSASTSVLRAYLKLYHRMEIVGAQHLPRDGRSFVMVANHASHLDALCLLSSLPREALNRAYPLAAEDYFFATLPRMAAASIFINAIPFGRQSHVRQTIQRCRRLLSERGNILILFPEGTRSCSGELSAFRPGIGQLLAGTNVPAVPCAIDGTYRAMRKGVFFPRPFKLRLTIGSPLSFEEFEVCKDSAQHISRNLHNAVKELLPCE